ncbi:MAG TPA: HAMP domain-containing sensor histidine kinase [Candidatus Limnocylindrales bacterium]|nr:HAMP domain-containing sensor histidine kinase [Candidatus Limnocylindrales bacterium]
MRHERANEAARERATLRLRLAGAALGATLLLLGTAVQREPAAIVLVLYVAGSLLLRYAAPRSRTQELSVAGIALDVVYAAALMSVLPPTEPAWALFIIAIGNAGQRFAAWGVVAATAGAIATYDVVLAARSPDSRAVELWPIQVLLAVGLVCTELVFVATRLRREQSEARAFALAQRDIASARDRDELLSRLVTHTTLAFGASRAAIREIDDESGARLTHRRGATSAEQRGAAGPEQRPASSKAPIEFALDERATLFASFTDGGDRAEAFVRDLADDARNALAALGARDVQRETTQLHASVMDAMRSLATEAQAPGVLATLVMSAQTLGGTASVIRRSDGTLVAGAAADPDVVAAARGTHPPAIATLTALGDGPVRHIAVASAGPGNALVLVSTRPIDKARLRALDTIGHAAGGVMTRIAERDALMGERGAIDAVMDRLEGQLREREDTLASTVHELRTPLTSVTAYGQLIAKNLQSALQQLAQLDRLIGDLRHDPRSVQAFAEIDLMQVAREAAQRQRILVDANVNVSAESPGPWHVKGDPGRLGQVLDNLLNNAVKFSPKGAAIDVVLAREGASVHVSVIDSGVGLAAAELDRVFDRYYRAGGSEVAGMGIGLAVSQEIVAAHGGRIWAESAGVGEGTTFTIALPIAVPVASEVT